MISSIFETLDGIARFIGWIAMIGVVLWFISRHLEEKQAYEKAQAEQKARFNFEAALKAKNPDKFRRYQEVKDKHRMNGDEVYWENAAIEAGITPAHYRTLMDDSQ